MSNTKPNIKIRGVHGTNEGDNQEADIGFPMVGMHTLFEGASIRELDTNENYNDQKKYLYLDPDSGKYPKIQDGSHFDCMKNGYYNISDNVDHYYIEESSKYIHHTVPAIDTWNDKLTFSNSIKNKELFSISNEAKRIFIDGKGYYSKDSKDYKKLPQTEYTLYKAEDISWNEQDKYGVSMEIGDDGTIEKWHHNGIPATSGYYISIYFSRDNNLYIIKLQNFIFDNNGICEEEIGECNLYKFNLDTNNPYVQNNNKLDSLGSNNKITFSADPTTAIKYIYYKTGMWQYPSIKAPDTTPALMTSPDGKINLYSVKDYPVFSSVTLKEINKLHYGPYTVYERIVETLNYKYKETDDILRIVFTDKTVPEIIEACNLDPRLEKYIHLTNLTYVK